MSLGANNPINSLLRRCLLGNTYYPPYKHKLMNHLLPFPVLFFIPFISTEVIVSIIMKNWRSEFFGCRLPGTIRSPDDSCQAVCISRSEEALSLHLYAQHLAGVDAFFCMALFSSKKALTIYTGRYIVSSINRNIQVSNLKWFHFSSNINFHFYNKVSNIFRFNVYRKQNIFPHNNVSWKVKYLIKCKIIELLVLTYG